MRHAINQSSVVSSGQVRMRNIAQPAMLVSMKDVKFHATSVDSAVDAELPVSNCKKYTKTRLQKFCQKNFVPTNLERHPRPLMSVL